MHENSEPSVTTPSTPGNPTAPVPADTILLGVSTFGDVDLAADGAPKHHAEVLRQVVEQAKVADAVGLHSFGVGEHHRKDFAVSAPDVVLAAIATATENIRLGSAVTVLSSDDPIRVFQRFATLDAVSNGRAEVILGRGSFTESFPLFGYDLADYDVLFEEKLDLYDRVRSQNPVNWDGRTRASPPGPDGLPARGRPPASHLDRRRRLTPVRGPHRILRLPDGPGDHRRRARALPPLCRPVPAHPCRSRQGTAGSVRALARLCGRDRRAGP